MEKEIDITFWDNMRKILIIKRINDNFDQFVCKCMRAATEDIDVKDIYRFHGRIGRWLVKFVKKMNKSILMKGILSLKKRDIEKYDQIIIFDDYPDLPLVKYLHAVNPKCIIKLWFWNVPNYSIDEYRALCELYCFDKDYCDRHNIKFLEQFYFTNITSFINHSSGYNTDIIYIGVDKGRKKLLMNLARQLDMNGISYIFKLVTNNTDDLYSINDYIDFQKDPMRYEDILQEDMKSKAILEIVTENQMGLTWRALESLYLKKKLITNNKKIVQYDFYNPNNIFILGENNINNLRSFIMSEFESVNEILLKKYSFNTWFELIRRR